MALTRDEIVQEALRLLDDEGLDGVTLRALADRLGVSAPTLYWHVRNKRELLDLMAEAIAASSAGDDDLAPRPGEPWWEWLHRRFREFRGALLSRRDAALVVAGNRPSPDIADRIERLVGMLVVAGFTPPEALRFLLVLGTYATGEALETQRARGRGPEPADAVAARREMVESGAHPLLSAAAEGLGGEDERFEEGLGLLIAGMRARLAERQAAVAGVVHLGGPGDPGAPGAPGGDDRLGALRRAVDDALAIAPADLDAPARE